MRCPNCGHEVPDDSAYCPDCGTRLASTGNDDKDMSDDSARSATARPNICPFCGSSLPEGSEFCPNCGRRIAGDDAGSNSDNISHTQAMPVIPEAPTRREAVPSPPQTPYTKGGRPADKPHVRRADTRTGARRSRTPLVALGSVAAVVVVALVVVMALGVGPFGSAGETTSNEAAGTTAETTNGSIATNANDNAANETTDSSTDSNTTGRTSNTNVTSANANSNTNQTSNANTNASSSASNNTSNTGDTSSTTSGSVSMSGGYVSNSNSTYGYSLTVPTSFTLTGSDSNGNATLTDTDSPCVITISVDDNPNGYTVDEALADASRGSTSGAYTAEGRGWYVFSDEPNGTVYYIMSYVREGRTISLRFTYPTSAKSQCDPIIESVQPTFSVN